MDKVKLGVIGIGNMGLSHCRNILQGKTPEIELVAVAERSEPRREMIAEEFGPGVQIFAEGDDLIDSDVCDAVLIVTPHYQHPPLAIRAFGRGQHVISEKPAGVYTKQVREMNEAAAKSGKVFALMYNQRTNCIYRKMKEIIDSGEMGAIRRVNWIITDWFRTQHYYDSGAWRATWEGEGGGVLLNQCPHNLDLMQWICGMPKMVRAFCHDGKWHDIEVEDDVTAYMEFENGATGTFITTTGDTPGTNRFEVTCDMGKLVCEKGELTLYRNAMSTDTYLRMAEDNYSKPVVVESVVETDGHNPQHVGVLNAFAGNILHGTPLVARGEEGIHGVMLSNAMHLSSWLGQPVALPIDEDVYLEELDKRRATSRCKDCDTVYIKAEGNYGS